MEKSIPSLEPKSSSNRLLLKDDEINFINYLVLENYIQPLAEFEKVEVFLLKL